MCRYFIFFFFSSRRRHTRLPCDWSSDVCSSDLPRDALPGTMAELLARCLAELDDADARALLTASAASYARAWRQHFSREHDPSAIRGERNAFRYRPCRRVIV